MQPRRFAYLAFALAIASAAMSVFWTIGGTWLLDTVGGSIEKIARTRSTSAVALGTAISLAKAGAAFLALALVRPWGRHVPTRVLKGANIFASAVLVTWGGANVLAGALVLTGVVSPADGLDERALRWHVFLWDLWFLLWGVAPALALLGIRRANRTTVAEAERQSPRVTQRADTNWVAPGDERRYPVVDYELSGPERAPGQRTLALGVAITLAMAIIDPAG